MPTSILDATIAGLCLALDAGDDVVLPILADALEEAGDSRAAGLRDECTLAAGIRPRRIPRGWGWWRQHRSAPAHLPYYLAPGHYDRLRGGMHVYSGAMRAARWRCIYSTRSAAILALAAALAEDALERGRRT